MSDFFYETLQKKRTGDFSLQQWIAVLQKAWNSALDYSKILLLLLLLLINCSMCFHKICYDLRRRHLEFAKLTKHKVTWQRKVWNIAYLTILDAASLKSCLPTTFADSKLELTGSNLTEDQLEDMLEQGQGAQLVGHVHIEGDADQLRQTINDIENRHEMFMNLEKSITELHDMFIDIATLIESQGEMVNRIDAHVDSAVEYTTRATNDTKKALEYQSKARRKKIMMMLCIIIGGGLAIWIGGKKLELF